MRRDIEAKATRLADERSELDWLEDCHKRDRANVRRAEMRLRNVETLIDIKYCRMEDATTVRDCAEELADAIAWYHEAIVAAGISDGASLAPDGRNRYIEQAIVEAFPQLTVSEARRIATAPRRRRRAKEVGTTFRVTFEERQVHRLWMVRPYDLSDDEFATRRDAWSEGRRLERRAVRRREDGQVTREDYIAGSNSELARRLGVERRTIKRWRDAGILDERIQDLEIKIAKCARLGPPISSLNNIGPQPGTSKSRFGSGRPPRAAHPKPMPLSDIDKEATEQAFAASIDDLKGVRLLIGDDLRITTFDRVAAILKPRVA